MQIDIHHTGIYVLCRIAGMKSSYASMVAYSSQQVDDATHGHALKFVNGDVFKQTMTAHKALSPYNFDISDALEVWMPFHFLPNGGRLNNKDAFVTSPDSEVLDLLLGDLLAAQNHDTALYRLGIGMHCFADTFSHQDFIGFFDSYNDVSLVKGFDERGIKDNALRLFFNFLNTFDFNFFAIGHGEVQANPDIPYAFWAYTRDGRTYIVRNLEERFLLALEKMLEYLISYVAQHTEYSSGITCRTFSEYKGLFKKLLAYEGTPEERHRYWLEHIQNNSFSFEDFDDTDKNLSYAPRQWFNEAVEKRKVNRLTHFHHRIYNYYEFTKKEGFDDSSWVKYMKAAYEHKHLVVHKILPQLGINVG